jgi:DNA-binding LacI/PurR family transcriptional regulator
MKDVAALAGVSLVHRLRASSTTRRSTRALARRVHDAVRRLGYRRDAAAAGLRRAIAPPPASA